ncbi:protein mono-ADP-ribosyltransferase PARP10 isoform X2 [Ascaphus truei]|uniref:protein mono-ADP-ribosyltransferase PARP10 isoform X2 n=1 Tax=Ascaphus truei TaxID=8439 RepID=UPI003F59D049
MVDVQVSGLRDGVDTEYLQLYFESKRLSGGGPVLSCTRDGAEALITFQNPQDAEQVLSEAEHTVQNVPLRVRRASPWHPGKVALHGLNPETSDSLLELYVERVSERDGFSTQRSADRTSAHITFQEPFSETDFGSMSQRVLARKLHGTSVSVQRVRASDQVLVQNLGPEIASDLLELYLESKRSGGGKVRSVTMLRDSGTAIVSFHDWQVVGRVVSRPHSLQNSELLLSPYYPALLYPAESRGTDTHVQSGTHVQSVTRGQSTVQSESHVQRETHVERVVQSAVQGETQGQSTMQSGTQGQSAVQGETQGQSTVQSETEGQNTVQSKTEGQSTVQSETRGQNTVQSKTPGHSENHGQYVGQREQSAVQSGTQGQSAVQGKTQGQSTVQSGTQGQSAVQGKTQRQSTVQSGTQGQSAVQGETQGQSGTMGQSAVQGETQGQSGTMWQSEVLSQTPDDLAPVWNLRVGDSLMMAEDTRSGRRSLQEVEVSLHPAELRFLQEYQHELLAMMDEVIIVPLEGGNKTGFRVSGDVSSCQAVVELLQHIVTSLSSDSVTLDLPGVSVFLLGEEGQQILRGIERQCQCVIDTSEISWTVLKSEFVDPWSLVNGLVPPEKSPVPPRTPKSNPPSVPPTADMKDIRGFAALLKHEEDEAEDVGELVLVSDEVSEPPNTSTAWNIRPEEPDLSIDLFQESEDVVMEEERPAGDEELDQACEMSRTAYQERQLDEEAELLLVTQRSMDIQQLPNMEEEEEELQRALEMSMREQAMSETLGTEDSLERALAMSLREQSLEETDESLQRTLEMSFRGTQEHGQTSGAEGRSWEEVERAMGTACLRVLAGDKTELVMACTAVRQAVTGKLRTETLKGVQGLNTQHAGILSALQRKYGVSITVSGDQAQVQGFTRSPTSCQQELAQILSALQGEGMVLAQGPPLIVPDMQRHRVKLFSVPETSAEYSRVVQPFHDTLQELRHCIQVLEIFYPLLRFAVCMAANSFLEVGVEESPLK